MRQTPHGWVRRLWVHAGDQRDLAGDLWVDRDPTYKPPVGTVLSFITSAGVSSPDDAFDKVVSPKYGTRKKILPLYGVNRVRYGSSASAKPIATRAAECNYLHL